jgi:CubicO group peptidase (beta-lactamase class C family)
MSANAVVRRGAVGVRIASAFSRAMLRTLLLAALVAACQTAPADDHAARIAAIEANLPPAVVIQGQPARGRGLAAAMNEMGVPSVSIAMIHDGRIAWTRQYGVTTPGGAPITETTRFQAGSVSKPIAALGAFALVQAGQIALDDDVNARLTAWRVPFEPTASGTVTLGGLLSHTAGVSVPGFPGYRTDADVPTLRQVLDGAAPANTQAIRVVSQPGERWAYSGGGYEIVQQLIEDVSGERYDSWMSARVFTPLDMMHSGYEQRLGPGQGDHALAHGADGAPIENGPYIYPEQAAAGLWSTPSDLALALVSIQRALAGERGADAQALARRMLTEVKPGRAMGFDVGGAEGARWFSKSGDTEGFGAFVVAYENGDGVAVMANGQSGSALAKDIVRAIAAAYGWRDFGSRERVAIALDAPAMARLAGRYRYRAGEFTVHYENGALAISSPGDEPDAAYAASADEIFTLSEDASFVFDASPGPAQAGRIVIGRTELPFQRIE